MRSLLIATLFLLGSTAFADTLLIERHTFVGEEADQRSETCQIFANKVVTTRSYGPDLTLRQVDEVQITGDVLKLMTAASEEKAQTEKDVFCEDPVMRITLFLGQAVTATLYNTGGCGYDRVYRRGPHSLVLLDIVNKYCPAAL